MPHTRCRSWDHPRICGEKVLWRIDWLVCVGITPAYAGKRFSCKSGEKQVGDHPRVCGEKIEQRIRDYQAGGSPPRMRGKGVGAAHLAGDHGITPAYAGKSKNTCTSVVFDQDHPRVCGEKVPAIRRFAQIMGSPPRMRGKGHRIPLRHPLQGITPAYAGKSSACRRTLSAGWDHPRICGEKFPNIHVPVCRSGSSPHMRGKDCGVADMVLPVRITPAYVGKSFEHTR